MSDRIPYIEPGVVEYFERLFPDRCPSITDSEREIFLAAGAVKVVKKMRQISERQANNVLQDNVLHETLLDEIGGDGD